jgi:hypothetical protein
VGQAVLKTDGGKFVLGFFEGVAHARQFQRNGDIFQRGHVRNEVEGLEDNTDIAAAKGSDVVFVHSFQRSAGNVDVASVRFLEAGKDHEKGRLAGTGRTNHPDGLALGNLEIDFLQDVDRICAASEPQVDG